MLNSRKQRPTTHHKEKFTRWHSQWQWLFVIGQQRALIRKNPPDYLTLVPYCQNSKFHGNSEFSSVVDSVVEYNAMENIQYPGLFAISLLQWSGFDLCNSVPRPGDVRIHPQHDTWLSKTAANDVSPHLRNDVRYLAVHLRRHSDRRDAFSVVELHLEHAFVAPEAVERRWHRVVGRSNSTCWRWWII